MTAHNIERLHPELHAAYLGEGQVFAVEGNRLHKPYLVTRLKSGQWACACEAVTECYHIRDAMKIAGGAPMEWAHPKPKDRAKGFTS